MKKRNNLVMIVLVNYFNNKACVFDSIIDIYSKKSDYILTDKMHNIIKIPRNNVESLKIMNEF